MQLVHVKMSLAPACTLHVMTAYLHDADIRGACH